MWTANFDTELVHSVSMIPCIFFISVKGQLTFIKNSIIISLIERTSEVRVDRELKRCIQFLAKFLLSQLDQRKVILKSRLCSLMSSSCGVAGWNKCRCSNYPSMPAYFWDLFLMKPIKAGSSNNRVCLVSNYSAFQVYFIIAVIKGNWNHKVDMYVGFILYTFHCLKQSLSQGNMSGLDIENVGTTLMHVWLFLIFMQVKGRLRMHCFLQLINVPWYQQIL